MIGLDTNILLRAALDDDATQSPLAREILSRLTAENPGVVNSVVLAEFAWTLRRGYDYSRSDIIDAVQTMLRSRGYTFPDRRAISLALSRCESDGLNFPDALIGEINRAAGCEFTLTFDERAAKSSAFQRAR
ncbi:MAG: type II toxin-antitoxin system VapC family toxin [Roseiarcus sp.]|jgi:predicted nucleic-acid-binding protein